MITLKILKLNPIFSKFLGGNPAAVCLLSKDLSDETKQKIAAEMNLSETAFVLPMDEKKDFSKSAKFELRWFTPTTEVPLCGHATLASATVLFYEKQNENVSYRKVIYIDRYI